MDLCLDISSGNICNGSNIWLYNSNNTAAQRFVFTSCSSQEIQGENLGTNENYTIRAFKNNSYVADINGFSFNDGATAQIYQANSSLAQTFHFEFDSNTNCYIIYCAGTNKVLGARYGSPVQQTWVEQKTYNGSDYQKWALFKNSTDGSISIVNRFSGLYLDITGGNINNGNHLNLYSSGNTSTQKFKLEKASLLVNGLINIYPQVNLSLCFDVPGASWDSGVQIQDYYANNSTAQKFYMKKLSDDTCQIKSACSQTYLIDNNSRAILDYNFSDAAKWKAQWTKYGISLINVKTNKALDVTSWSGSSGVKIQTCTQNNSKAQAFTFISTNAINYNQTVTFSPQCAITSSMDLSNGSWYQGATIQIWEGFGSDNQKWRIENCCSDLYRIVNCKTEYVLDVCGGSSADGALLQQYAWNGSWAQLWRINVTEDGWYEFVSPYGKRLDVCGASSGNGTWIDVYSSNKSSAQHWRIHDTSIQTFSGNGDLDSIIRCVCKCYPTLDSLFNFVRKFPYRSGDLWPGGEWTVPYAIGMFRCWSGNCYRYSALFMWCAHGLGYSCNCVCSQLPLIYGGANLHAWVEVYINGGTYICDPEMAYEMPGHNWYLCTYDNTPINYIR